MQLKTPIHFLLNFQFLKLYLCHRMDAKQRFVAYQPRVKNKNRGEAATRCLPATRKKRVLKRCHEFQSIKQRSSFVCCAILYE